MRNWFSHDCSCNDATAILGTIINGRKYESDSVTTEQYAEDMKKVASALDSMAKSQTETDANLKILAEKHASDISQIFKEITVLHNTISDISKNISAIDERVKKLESAGPEIKITSFKASPVVALAGSEIDVKLTWAFNTQATSITVNGTAVSGTSYTSNRVNSSRTFTLIATDKNGNTDTATAKIDFMNNIVYGSSSDTAPSSDMLAGLATKVLSEEISRTISVDTGAGAYIYYAYPKRLGKVKFYTYGMFEGGFEDPVTVLYTNAQGFAEEYTVYRSSNILTEEIEVQVTKEV